MNIFKTPLPFYAPDDEGAGGGGDDVKQDAGADVGGADKGTADPGGADAGADKSDGDKGGSFLAGADDPAGDDGKKVVAPADWPEDWRDKMANGDEAMRKRLDRFKAPGDVFKSYTELEGKFKKGAPSNDEPMPDAEKEPEKAKEWRQARGIPDEPSGYVPPDSVKAMITDEDKPNLASFTEHMHKSNVPASAVGPALEWYFQQQQAGAEAIAAADRTDKTETEDALRSEWGSDFRSFATVAKRFADEAVPGLLDARLPNGRVVGNDPAFVKMLADLGMREYGDVSFAGGEATNRTMARKEELETMMSEEPDKYFNNKKYQQEYLEIMEAEAKRAGNSGSRHAAKPA